ncbi:unnamed protein product [Amoebophrya sp. A120]|nr:unnamed protein product [Amoebophrya sp. A120]|eukprot:GSA120T00004930001.1
MESDQPPILAQLKKDHSRTSSSHDQLEDDNSTRNHVLLEEGETTTSNVEASFVASSSSTPQSADPETTASMNVGDLTATTTTSNGQETATNEGGTTTSAVATTAMGAQPHEPNAEVQQLNVSGSSSASMSSSTGNNNFPNTVFGNALQQKPEGEAAPAVRNTEPPPALGGTADAQSTFAPPPRTQSEGTGSGLQGMLTNFLLMSGGGSKAADPPAAPQQVSSSQPAVVQQPATLTSSEQSQSKETISADTSAKPAAAEQQTKSKNSTKQPTSSSSSSSSSSGNNNAKNKSAAVPPLQNASTTQKKLGTDNTPPVTSRSNETWTGNKLEIKNHIDELRAEILEERALKKSNSLTALRQHRNRQEELDDQENPIRVARCELNAIQMRPVVNSELSVYVSLKDIRNNRHWEDKPLCTPVIPTGLEEDKPLADEEKPVKYRWSRGPVIAPCVYHKHKTSILRDTSKTFQFYCSRECLHRGWRSLPKEMWQENPMNSAMEDQEKTQEERLAQKFREQQRLDWDIQLKSDWETISEGRTYSPSIEDINRPLRFEVIPLDKEGEAVEKFAKSCTTGTVIPTPKEARTRRMLSFGGSFNAAFLNKQFKIMNWNVLADLYATEAQYPYCEKFALSWMFRKHLIIKEIKSINADIVTLQEVQEEHFFEWFKPNLEEAGYEGVYQQKKQKNPVFHRGRYAVEGCATFFKKSRFCLREKRTVEFDEEARSVLENESMQARLSKGNIALILILEDLVQKPDMSTPDFNLHPKDGFPRVGPGGGHTVGVVNTHILADPEFTDVKLWQGQLLVNSLDRYYHDGMPLLVCGDFNSTPQSAVYELWHDGHVSPNHEDLDRPDICGLLANPFIFKHDFRLMSAYEACSGEEAQYTNYTEDFTGTLDYIWFTPDKVVALAVSAVDDDTTLQQETALPSSTRPSDHISLVTTFMFAEPRTKNAIADKQKETMTELQKKNKAKFSKAYEEAYGFQSAENFYGGPEASHYYGYHNQYWDESQMYHYQHQDYNEMNAAYQHMNYNGGANEWYPMRPASGGPIDNTGGNMLHNIMGAAGNANAGPQDMMGGGGPGGKRQMPLGGLNPGGADMGQQMQYGGPQTGTTSGGLGNADSNTFQPQQTSAMNFTPPRDHGSTGHTAQPFSPGLVQDFVKTDQLAVNESLMSEEDTNIRRPLSAMELRGGGQQPRDQQGAANSDFGGWPQLNGNAALGGHLMETPNSRQGPPGYSDEEQQAWANNMAMGNGQMMDQSMMMQNPQMLQNPQMMQNQSQQMMGGNPNMAFQANQANAWGQQQGGANDMQMQMGGGPPQPGLSQPQPRVAQPQGANPFNNTSMSDQEMLRNTILQEQQSDSAHGVEMGMFGQQQNMVNAAQQSKQHPSNQQTFSADSRMNEHLARQMNDQPAQPQTWAATVSAAVASTQQQQAASQQANMAAQQQQSDGATSTSQPQNNNIPPPKLSMSSVPPKVPPPPPPPPPPSLPPFIPSGNFSATSSVGENVKPEFRDMLPPPTSHLPQHLISSGDSSASNSGQPSKGASGQPSASSSQPPNMKGAGKMKPTSPPESSFNGGGGLQRLGSSSSRSNLPLDQQSEMSNRNSKESMRNSSYPTATASTDSKRAVYDSFNRRQPSRGSALPPGSAGYSALAGNTGGGGENGNSATSNTQNGGKGLTRNYGSREHLHRPTEPGSLFEGSHRREPVPASSSSSSHQQSPQEVTDSCCAKSPEENSEFPCVESPPFPSPDSEWTTSPCDNGGNGTSNHWSHQQNTGNSAASSSSSFTLNASSGKKGPAAGGASSTSKGGSSASGAQQLQLHVGQTARAKGSSTEGVATDFAGGGQSQQMQLNMVGGQHQQFGGSSQPSSQQPFNDGPPPGILVQQPHSSSQSTSSPSHHMDAQSAVNLQQSGGTQTYHQQTPNSYSDRPTPRNLYSHFSQEDDSNSVVPQSGGDQHQPGNKDSWNNKQYNHKQESSTSAEPSGLKIGTKPSAPSSQLTPALSQDQQQSGGSQQSSTAGSNSAAQNNIGPPPPMLNIGFDHNSLPKRPLISVDQHCNPDVGPPPGVTPPNFGGGASKQFGQNIAGAVPPSNSTSAGPQSAQQQNKGAHNFPLNFPSGPPPPLPSGFLNQNSGNNSGSNNPNPSIHPRVPMPRGPPEQIPTVPVSLPKVDTPNHTTWNTTADRSNDRSFSRETVSVAAARGGQQAAAAEKNPLQGAPKVDGGRLRGGK